MPRDDPVGVPRHPQPGHQALPHGPAQEERHLRAAVLGAEGARPGGFSAPQNQWIRA